MPSPSPIRVAVVGASGYSGEELVRILLNHPAVELSAVTSRQHNGKQLGEIFPRFAGNPRIKNLSFSDPAPEVLAKESQVVFLALPHGVAATYAVPLLKHGARVIDLSADFRLRDAAVYKEFYQHDHPAPELLAEAVYGLPELRRDKIRSARLIAAPGCYPTSILLPLLPLLADGLIAHDSIVVNSLSGVSGAGRKVESDYLFVECNESVRPYGVPKHRHLSEIEQELSLAANAPIQIQFTPHLIPVNRGILTTIYALPSESARGDAAPRCAKQIGESLTERYQNEPFVRLLSEKQFPDTKNVTGSNMIEIAWRVDPRTGRMILMSAEDNLGKGAAGQAVQNMNLMFGLEETAGL